MRGVTKHHSFLQNLLRNILVQGPMPKHIAIIMDGNRRFPRKHGLASVTEGHEYGQRKLGEVLEILETLEVPEVTVFAFSTENFKRAKEEVDGLTDLLVKLFRENMDRWEETEIRVEFIGDYKRAPTVAAQNLIAKCMCDSRYRKKFKLNIAYAYGGQEEIVKGLNALLGGLTADGIKMSDPHPKLLEDTFTLHSANPVDIILRPAGDHRLSDFLLWQGSKAYLHFIDEVDVLLRELSGRQNKRNIEQMDVNLPVESLERQRKFLAAFKNDKWRELIEAATQAPRLQDSLQNYESKC